MERNVTLNSSLISIGFKVRLREKDPCAGDSDSVAFSLGLRSYRSRIPLVELGTRENQTVIPFNEYYPQDAWIPFRADVDLAAGETSVYQWDNLLGEIDMISTRPSSINSLYIRVGGGSRHEARVDEIIVTECEVSESVSILAMLMIVILPMKIFVAKCPNPY